VSDERLRVAFVGPLQPVGSEIASYIEVLLPHLAGYWNIDLFVDGHTPTSPVTSGHRIVDIRDKSTEDLLPGYDILLYRVGNDPVHVGAYETFLRHPGVVIMHEVTMAQLVVEANRRKGRRDLLFAELREQHGDHATEWLRRHCYLGEAAPWDANPLRYSLNRRVLVGARGLVVHSRFAERLAREGGAACPIAQVAHPAPLRPTPPAELGASRRPLVVCTAGCLTREKQIEKVLRALARLRPRFDFRYELIGNTEPGYRLGGVVQDLGLGDRVRHHGPVSNGLMSELLGQADICVNLQDPTCGETSAVVLQALAGGRPVVVSDTGWYAELPDDCALKIPPGPGDLEALTTALETLATDPERRRSMARSALGYARAHEPSSCAKALDGFIRSVLGRQ